MAETENAKSYLVLARKYRPQKLSEIIGQPGMVRIITNAFESDRLAHAFILTGVRGVGKTTTARIIAKGLNCTGADGNGGPTTEPCGVCENCQQITNGSHLDILEMDAASRTGVDDVREIIDTVAYGAALARYKVYIIDEVHMLSRSAFNALLKTLEEPPPHVKFIFATTEIGKVPATVLSRCQRFDLRRIETRELASHLGMIARNEDATIEDEALQLIIRASEGSVRDAISLLDQAIAYGEGAISADQVREMLALADNSRTLDLLELVMAGNAGGALEELASQYSDGVDPEAVLRDLADAVHWLSVVKFTSKGMSDLTLSPAVRERGQEMGRTMSLPDLARAWQVLLKCLAELPSAPSAISAAEMAVIRLCCVTDMPTPEELIRIIDCTDSITGSSANGSVSEAVPAHDPGHPAEEPEDMTETGDSEAAGNGQNLSSLLDNPLVKGALKVFPDATVMVSGKQVN